MPNHIHYGQKIWFLAASHIPLAVGLGRGMYPWHAEGGIGSLGVYTFVSIRNEFSFEHPSHTATPRRAMRSHVGSRWVTSHVGPRVAKRGHVRPRNVILEEFAQFPYQRAVITEDFAPFPYQPAVVTKNFAPFPYQPGADFAHVLEP